jgi:hypothetical protein
LQLNSFLFLRIPLNFFGAHPRAFLFFFGSVCYGSSLTSFGGGVLLASLPLA